MTYTGHVEADGPWQERVDGGVRIRKLSVGEMDNNVYVIACAQSGRALVVDAADRPERIREAVADVEPLAVVQTHGHFDHVRAWESLTQDPGLEVWGNPGDADMFPKPLDRELGHGDVLEVGELRVEVLHVPGHTPGSLLYLVEGAERPHLLSGDTLFPGGAGNTFGDADKFTQIMDGLEREIFDRLPDETWVYPGHGDDTTIGQERPKLPEWRERGW
jgi:glyoxylase-like metal-dependent hydrolase (beta-lactamase superfamily II)